MRSTFATKTFAIHWSIVTGLFEENTGILGNEFWDPVTKREFSSKTVTEAEWFSGDPVWSVASKQGKKSCVSQWMGSGVKEWGDDRLPPDLLDPFVYSENVSSIHANLRVVEDFMQEQECDLSLLYFHEPDMSGHRVGAFSTGVRDTLSVLDSAFGAFFQRMASRLESANVILLADHGMHNVSRILLLDQILREPLDPLIEHADAGGVILQVWPLAGSQDRVYQLLKSAESRSRSGGQPAFTVYLKADIPIRWHYTRHYRIAPIVLVAEEGVHVWRTQQSWGPEPGDHGYDNEKEDMRPVFLARGPAFLPASRLQQPLGLENVFSLVCQLIGVTPPASNGSAAAFEAILRR